MANYLSQCLTATSPYNDCTGQTSGQYPPFYYDTSIITSWYNNGGGIMIYDFQSTGTLNSQGTSESSDVLSNNNDVQSYFVEVYNSRNS